jgi:MFS family permease
VLGIAAVLVAVVPHLAGDKARVFFLVFMAYGFFFMSSYPMVEAGVMQAVPDSVRGRAFGLWITIGGLTGNLSHWLIGHWVESFGPRAARPETYFALYGVLALMLLLSLVGLPCLQRVREREHLENPPGDEPSAVGVPHSALE